MIAEYSRVRTIVQKGLFPAGSVGVVVSVYSSGTAYEVEMWDEDNYPVDVVTYLYAELEIIPGDETFQSH